MEVVVMGLNNRKFAFPIFIIPVLIGSFSLVFSSNIDDKKAIKAVIKGLSDAWEQGDGSSWGEFFTEDADFTVWFGLHLDGRKEISEGHQWLFDSFYPNSRYELEITDLKFLKSDVAVVHLNGSVINPDDKIPAVPHSFPVAILQKINTEWKIVMFHNMQNRINEIESKREMGKRAGDIRH